MNLLRNAKDEDLSKQSRPVFRPLIHEQPMVTTTFMAAMSSLELKGAVLMEPFRRDENTSSPPYCLTAVMPAFRYLSRKNTMNKRST